MQETSVADAPDAQLEAVRHLQELLRIDTTNPPGNETAAAEYLAAVARREGYEPVLLEPAPGRGNVVLRHAGSGTRLPLLLYGHTDVVPADGTRWEHGPFSGAESGGAIWGRGALDMKSLVAQQLMVMLLLRRHDVRLSRDVIFAATADEECGGTAGMGFLVRDHADLIRAEYGLSEGGGTTMYVAGSPLYDIRTAEKGTCRFVLRAHGEPGHASIPRPHTAVSRLAEAVVALTSTPFPFHVTPTFERFFVVLTDLLGVPPEERRPTRENVERVLRRVPPTLADYIRAICHDTAVPTALRAGEKINVIPDRAEASVDGRYLPGGTADRFLAEARRIVGDSIEIDTIGGSPPLETAPGGPLYAAITRAVERHAPGATVTPMMLSGATDARHVSRLGTHCLGFGPVQIDETFPADRLTHGHNERVPRAGYLWGMRVLYDIVTAFCA